MGDTVWAVIVAAGLILGAYLVLGVGCEYRNFGSGHKLIKAFWARRWYQRIFTVFQTSRTVDAQDIGKLTYIGFAGVVVAAAAVLVIIPIDICTLLSEYNDGKVYLLSYWWYFCLGWALLCIFLQLLDCFICSFARRWRMRFPKSRRRRY